jgi:hypothetical protein
MGADVSKEPAASIFRKAEDVFFYSDGAGNRYL